MKIRIKVIMVLLCCRAVTVEGRSVDVRKYGAKGDGEKVCSVAFRRAVEAAKEGDTVVVPAGRYVTGTVRLKSRMTLMIEKGAEICGVKDLKGYEHYLPGKDMTRYDTGRGTVNANVAGDEEWTKALILCVGIEDVTVCGEGAIDGQHVENAAGEEGMRGPHAVLIAESRNVRVEGVTIRRAGNYAVMGYELKDASFTGLSIKEGWDGVHIRGGVNINIIECEIMTGDDAIAGGYWENMRIKGCRLNSSCNGIRMIEPSRNLTIEECHIYGPGVYAHRTRGDETRRGSIYGIVLEPGAWGYALGRTENVCIRNVTVDNMLSVLVYSMGEGNACSGLYIDGLKGTRIEHNTLPLNWQGGTGMWNNVIIKDMTIKNGER